MANSNKVAVERKPSQVEEQQNPSQIYDTSMKELVDRQVKDILPVLLPGVSYKKTLNVEVVKPVLRADKVYNVSYCRKKHILHLEFESGRNRRMGERMSAYNSVLHLEHELPVISIVIYPFKTKMAVSPLIVKGGDGVITTFNYHIIPLFMLNAEQYLREHIVCMYPLLAVMKGANRRLLKEAIEELAKVYRHDKETLGDFFAYMVVLLERSSTMTRLEKQKAKEELNVYNSLWDRSPIIQQMRAASKAEGWEEGKAEGKAEGELLLAQRMLVNIVNARFPKLTELAQQKAGQMQNAGLLERLVQQVAVASDEDIARSLLISVIM
jgi:hypothetical protein